MHNWATIQKEQQELCSRLQTDWTPIDPNAIIGFNRSLFSGTMPVNGLRHPKHGNATGWYLWTGGEIPLNDDHFFEPIHAGHLLDNYTWLFKYLGLPAGWRFQIDTSGYEDVWFDKSLRIINN
ncbi:immunity protein Imm33 domain-containing protein [Sediminibacterium ginsengisoli]|uniref:Imm33-like domain-containing protein n=1 Tax=Sediminibacterium ginsengisoli TaxID=413434 RepID=A0A1T4R073_9BACT|nr:hypothetical protein [Sediminibacterium ginsengisoli]SKA09374.1 hypothetical protein SAMN04488132_11032 [Sediminibacterium ginsengisoli]